MDSSDNLNPPEQNSALDRIKEQCSNLVIDECTSLMNNMLGQLEADFLEAADSVTHQAEKISTRSSFMEAQAKIEKNAAEITDHFQQQLAQGFSQFIESGKGSTAAISTYGPDIEDDIALRKMAFECRNLYFKQLYELRHRMALVRGGKKIEEKELPGGPTHIINSFYSAIAPLELNRQIQTSLYKLFEKYVMNELSATYERYNSLLKDAGLFPHLKPISTQLPSEESEEISPEPVTAEPSDQGQGTENLEWAAETTSTWLDASHDDTNIPTYEVGLPAEDDAHTPPEEVTTDIIEALNRIQPLTSTSINAHATLPDMDSTTDELDAQLAQDLRKSLASDEQQLFESVRRHNFSKIQVSTIKLVRWIFEQIIDSPLLPGASKALICNLHIPYLKIAILDPGLFNQSNHPARELLNLMISGGGQWVDEFNLQKGIYPKLSETVDRILFDFSDNIQLFDELLTDFKDASQKLQHKTEVVEQRTRESARGRDKLDSVRNTVAGIIQEHTQGQQLPSPIMQFLRGAWSDRLALMLLRDPRVTSSPTWQDALDMTGALSDLGAEGPIEDIPLERRQELAQRFTENLSLLGDYQSKDVDDLLRFLTASVSDLNQDTSITQPEQEEEAFSTAPLSEKEQRILEKVLKIEPGTWFELALNGNRRTQRAKLSWRSQTSSNHMFVDQSGTQVAMMPAETLARDLCKGNAHILGHYRIPFVDKAIKDIGTHFKNPS